MIKIAVDAMGGDNSPNKIIDGIILHYSSNKNVFYKIFGDEKRINNCLKDKIEKFDTTLLAHLIKKEKIYIKNKIENTKNNFPKLIASKIDEESFGPIQESLFMFPGFYSEKKINRKYNYKYAAHTLGYIREVNEKEIKSVSDALELSTIEVESRITELHEHNPMLGHRGCRLGISFPEIYEMQIRAIFEALVECKKRKIKSTMPEIMIPLVSTEAEIKIMKELVINIARKVQNENKTKIKFLVGTMIELPRAAIKAKEIAKYAEFFSFGTNDLTQTTFGISRDDSGKFLNDYIENKIFDIDPFISIDDGVGELIEIAVTRGKKQNKKIKLGICGEHGGDPKSIEFCSKVGLDYVSCSPYRVPVARLAAAQAQLKK